MVEKGDLGPLFSGTGLVFYGGALGGALAVMAYAKYRGFLDYRLFDMGAPALAIGYAVGRLGCQLAGDGDYGIPSDLPWAMAIRTARCRPPTRSTRRRSTSSSS